MKIREGFISNSSSSSFVSKGFMSGRVEFQRGESGGLDDCIYLSFKSFSDNQNKSVHLESEVDVNDIDIYMDIPTVINNTNTKGRIEVNWDDRTITGSIDTEIPLRLEPTNDLRGYKNFTQYDKGDSIHATPVGIEVDDLSNDLQIVSLPRIPSSENVSYKITNYKKNKNVNNQVTTLDEYSFEGTNYYNISKYINDHTFYVTYDLSKVENTGYDKLYINLPTAQKGLSYTICVETTSELLIRPCENSKINSYKTGQEIVPIYEGDSCVINLYAVNDNQWVIKYGVGEWVSFLPDIMYDETIWGNNSGRDDDEFYSSSWVWYPSAYDAKTDTFEYIFNGVPEGGVLYENRLPEAEVGDILNINILSGCIQFNIGTGDYIGDSEQHTIIHAIKPATEETYTKYKPLCYLTLKCEVAGVWEIEKYTGMFKTYDPVTGKWYILDEQWPNNIYYNEGS
jgi:hypothetical protein